MTKSFKTKTKTTFQRKTFNEKLIDLEKKADEIKKIKKIMSTIIANGCYSKKEEGNQLFNGSHKGELTDSEMRVLKKGWEFRRKQSRNLEKQLYKLLEEYDE